MTDACINENWDSTDEHIIAIERALLVLLKKYNHNLKYDLCTKNLSAEILCLKAKLLSLSISLPYDQCKVPANIIATYRDELVDSCHAPTSIAVQWSNTCSAPGNIQSVYVQGCEPPTGITTNYVVGCDAPTNILALFLDTCEPPTGINTTYVVGCNPIENLTGNYTVN